MGAQKQEGVGDPRHGPALPRNYIAWGSAPWGSREPGRQEGGNGKGGRVWGRPSRGEGCPGLNAQVGPLDITPQRPVQGKQASKADS